MYKTVHFKLKKGLPGLSMLLYIVRFPSFLRQNNIPLYANVKCSYHNIKKCIYTYVKIVKMWNILRVQSLEIKLI